MKVNNNNQTSFGIRDIIVVKGSKEFAQRINDLEPLIRRESHPAATLLISQTGIFDKVDLNLVVKTEKGPLVSGGAGGRAFTPGLLLRIIRKAAARMNEAFISTQLPHSTQSMNKADATSMHEILPLDTLDALEVFSKLMKSLEQKQTL